MMFVFFLALLLGQTLAATTTHRPSREPAVTDSFSFKYDPVTHMIAALTHHKCYIYTMSADESTAVHTAHGLHMLETKLINMVDDTTQTYTTMSHADVTAASKSLATFCNHQGNTAYKLN